ncbi:protein-tyrosine phosphatase-like protein [Lophiotrema nucula]|uniref:Protein-tyrosine phosphatase-like protein n=1 Tax=Lophiotrema nucula TaxID=690887 RepID=A0A6A5ZK77_9PLEO|nr:protein-tyrosine phosphatase-like protein [Lophiotrema nucula]
MANCFTTSLGRHVPVTPLHDSIHLDQIEGVNNFREIGGWPIATPSTVRDKDPEIVTKVRHGFLYRGGDTVRITAYGEMVLRYYKIKKDFDLRSKQQIEKLGSKKIDRIEYVWAPVFAEEDYTEEAAQRRYEQYAGDGTEGIVEAFIEILTHGAKMFRQVLHGFLDDKHATVFMHCTTGNNRTGVFVSLLLLLLNVPHAAVCKEYALSEKGLAKTRHVNIARLLAKGAFKEYDEAERQRRCERMLGAREESMEALITEVYRRWQGPEGYFKELVGLNDEEIKRLRTIMSTPKHVPFLPRDSIRSGDDPSVGEATSAGEDHPVGEAPG